MGLVIVMAVVVLVECNVQVIDYTLVQYIIICVTSCWVLKLPEENNYDKFKQIIFKFSSV